MNTNYRAELDQLYRKWPVVRRYLKDLGCRGTTAEDIFQEALLIYIRKMDEPGFTLTTEPVMYIRQVSKFLWYNQSRKDSKLPIDHLGDSHLEFAEDQWMEKELKHKRVEHALAELGKQCRQLLEEFYGLGRSMAEIATSLGLRNERVAKVQKYRCMQKAKELVAKHESVELEIQAI